MKNTLIQAYQNERAVLHLLHRYGHVRQTDIGRAIWPASSEATAKSMAHRTLARLIDQKQIVRLANRFRGYSYSISTAGVSRLDLIQEDGARSGRGLTSVTGQQFSHRTLGTRYLIEKEIAGLTAHSEYAIYCGSNGISRKKFAKEFKKIPDGLVLVNGAARGLDPELTAVDWIEVEGAYKPQTERRKILSLSAKQGTWIDRDRKMLLDRIVFVYSSMDSHERSLLNGIDSYVREQKIADPHILSSIVLARCDIRPPFTWVGYTEVSWLQRQLLDGTKFSAAPPELA